MSSRTAGISHPKFIQDLAYTFGSDVSASGWKRSSSDTRKAYDFSYDGFHRLKDAVYKEGSSVNDRYTEKVTGYDRNGNITGLQRYGRTGTSTALQPEKYQGKDWNPAASFNVYDFGARLYDPALGRWLAQDPLAEKFYPQSPYLFCAGNPMKIVDPTGQEWKEKNKIISVSLNLMAEGFDDDFLDTYKKTVSTMFDEIIRSASGGSYGGEIVFYTNNPEIVQSLSFVASMDNSIGGTTTWMYSIINSYDNSGKIQSFTELAKTTIHELFHTIRLEHPFEKTQTRDTQLIKIGPNSYNTTAFTDPNIVNNIMNYSFISIDG